jgi:hypothetical protein
MWKALGNQRPTLLRSIEKMLWEAIFSIARGEGAKSALEKFLARIPWDNLDSIEDSERHWFHAGKDDPPL